MTREKLLEAYRLDNEIKRYNHALEKLNSYDCGIEKELKDL